MFAAFALAGCGGADEPVDSAGEQACADDWNERAGGALRYMADVEEAGAAAAFVGEAEGRCIVYVQNPGDPGEVYVFEQRDGAWQAPKRADVPELRQLSENARIRPGGRIELD